MCDNKVSYSVREYLHVLMISHSDLGMISAACALAERKHIYKGVL